MNTLFPLPERNETRLERAKREHCIWTQCCFSDPIERRWLAAKLPPEQWQSNSEMFKIEWVIEHDEEACDYAETEADAVIKLGKRFGLKITL